MKAIIDLLNVAKGLVGDRSVAAQELWNDLDEYGRESGQYATHEANKHYLGVAERAIRDAIHALGCADDSDEALKDMQEERMAADIAMLEGPAWREPDNE